MRNRLLTSLALPAALATAGLLNTAETAYAGFADSPNQEGPRHGHIRDHERNGHERSEDERSDHEDITAPLGDTPAVVSGDGRYCPPLGNVTVFDYGQDCAPLGNVTVFDYGIQSTPLGNATVFDYGIHCSPVGDFALPGVAQQGFESSSVTDFSAHSDPEPTGSELPPR